MKKLITLLALFSLSGLYAKVETSSQSFLFTRPVFNNIETRASFGHNALFDYEKSNGFRLTPLYQTSFKSSKLKRYFLLADHDSVSFSNTAANRDVRPEWFGLPNNFGGTMTVKPEQTQFGFDFSVRHSIDGMFDISLFKNSWLFATLPIVVIKNHLNFSQSSITNSGAAGTAAENIVSAFNNSAWNYLKMRTSSKSETRPGELRLGMGKTFLNDGRAHLASYSSISIPTDKKQTNKYMFDPQAGFNGHVGMVWGAHLQLPITRKTDPGTVALYLDFESNFLFRNHQYRTFDLVGKEWSRYLLYRKSGSAAEQGVNVMTRKVRVSAYNLIDASAGFRFHVKKAEAEIGVSAWGHGKERIDFVKPWEAVYGIAGTTNADSASASTIKTLAADDAAFTTVKFSDIDLASGASVSTMTWRAHAAIGARGQGEKADGFFGAGVFVEMPRNATKMFHQWGGWFTVGAAF
jgi:hypothetical protein